MIAGDSPAAACSAAGRLRCMRLPPISPLILVALLLLPHVGRCTEHAAATEIWLVPDLTAESLRDPALTASLDQASLALVNCAVAGHYSAAAQMLTISLGYRVAAAPGDGEIRLLTEATVEGNVPEVFQRRTLLNPLAMRPLPSAVHLGIGPLERRGLSQRLLGEVVKQGPGSAIAVADIASADRAIGLLAVRADGLLPVQVDPHVLVRQLTTQDVPRRLRDPGLPERVLILGYPARSEASAPPRLGLAALFDHPRKPGLLTSGTTRTPGLIANVDIAPTLLDWLDVPVPAWMQGRPLQHLPASQALAVIQRLDYLTRLNRRALAPVFVALGIAVLTAGTLGLTLGPRSRLVGRLCAFTLLALMTMPLALMAAAFFVPPSPLGLLALCVLIMAVLASGALLASRGRWDAAPWVVAWATIAWISADTLSGQPLAKISLLSSGILEGMRYYGIGNELMGVFIGFTVLAACGSRLPLAAATGLAVWVALLLGSPWHGANAGGFITAVVACGAALACRKGWRIGPWAAAALALGGCAGAALLAVADARLTGNPSHMGSTLAAAHRFGHEHVVAILTRKLQMNARILLNPWMLTAIGCIGAVVFAPRWGLAARVREIAERYPDWSAALPAILWGGLAALLFNDSGAIAASFLVGAWLVTGGFLFVTQHLTSSHTSP